MHKILEKKLVAKYPDIFKDYGGDIRQTCMGWGLACGKGWFLLLDKLCNKIKDMNVVARQVKEKFGTLRFYIDGDEEAHKIVSEYEGKFAYCFPDSADIVIFDPLEGEDPDPIFEGTIYEFMELMAPYLRLLEDPMSTTDKPLWERI